MTDNLTGILDNIREYADSTVLKLARDAGEKAEAVIAEARANASVIEAETMQQLKRESALIESQAETDFLTLKRDRTLALKQELIGQVYQRTLEKLSGLPGERKLALYSDWLRKYAEPDEYTIRLCEADLRELGTQLAEACAGGDFPGTPSVSGEPGSFSGGFILEYADTREDLTFEAVVGELKGKADGEIIKEIYRS